MKQDSPNFKNGKFHNINPTPQWAEDSSSLKVLKEMLFKKVPHKIPEQKIPSEKTNLKKISIDEEILVWFGHSSYFMQVEGKRFLIDPVFSGSVSPVPGMLKAFEGTDIYTAADIPNIDYLVISHDHYDHLDYKTIHQLQPKINQVICGLGVGAHFEKWGYPSSMVWEKDWFDKIDLNDEISLHILPARHFSGRGLNRNSTLWCSFLLQTPSMKIYLGGDSGYDQHFAEIGQKFGEIDLAILENGQYNEPWPYIHMFPKQVLQAAKDLNAQRLFPVHSSKFALSQHSWKEPLTKITQLNEEGKLPLITPLIGEKVVLKDKEQRFVHWWESVE